MATLKEIAAAAAVLPPNVSIMLSGMHGCGKTEWTENFLGKHVFGLDRVVTWHPAHAADTGDVTGLPDKQKNMEGELVTKFCPPDWMLQSEPVLLLIDEANRGLSLVQNAIMQLTCSGSYGNIRLPKGSRIVACINPDENGEYDVGTMDLAQKDRFCWFDFTPSFDETIEYFSSIHLDQRVIDYLTDNPSQLDFDHFKNKELLEAAKNTGMGTLPSCRSWERVARTVQKADELGYLQDQTLKKSLLIAIEGLVGTTNAINFAEYLNKVKVLSPIELLNAITFDNAWNDQISSMTPADADRLIKGVCIWCKSNDDSITQLQADNFTKMFQLLKPDIQRNMVINDILPAVKSNAGWITKLTKLNPTLKNLYIQACRLTRVV